MKPVKIALVNRVGSVPGERNAGWWAYPVPEFTVNHFPQRKGDTLNRSHFGMYDLIVWEDGKSTITWLGHGPPIAYQIGDSTISADCYQHRRDMAQQADLLLVDWDRLERFADLGKPVRRFAYCVNDERFRPYADEPKSVDVAYHMTEDGDRQRLGDWLAGYCDARGYTMSRGSRVGEDYARAFARARVAINVNRTPTTRNHRFFDAMACGAAVLSDPTPEVSSEARTIEVHYCEFAARALLGPKLDYLLRADRWLGIAEAGRALVIERHMWSVRARQLRQTVAEVFGV